MTPTDTSALLAKREAMARQKPYSPEWCSARVAYQDALVSADDLLDELDQLRGQVARVEAWYGWRRGADAPDEALAAPAEGGEHVHLFESDGCINVGCTTQVCAACGHVENPHVEGCKAAEGGE